MINNIIVTFCIKVITFDIWEKNMAKKYYPILLALVLFIFYFQTLVWLVESWMYNPYYSHGFIIPGISLYFIWTKKDSLTGPMQRTSQELGFYLILVALLIHGLGFFWTIKSLSGISLIMSITGVILFLYGKEIIKELSFPLLFLIFSIPLPINDFLTPAVQYLSTVSSTFLAGLIGIPAHNVGYVIYIPAGSFEVGLPCSGLRSVISLMAVAAVFAYILEGSKRMKAVIFFSSIPLALMGNIVRITSVLFIADRYTTQVAMSFFHGFSSLVLFSISLLGLFLVGRCFGRLRFKKTL